MIERIKKLQKCKELGDQVKAMVAEVSKPQLSDLSLIPYMHSVYSSMYAEETPRTRKAFLFVVLYLYCPVAFVKIRRLQNGLRSKLAEALGCQPTVISHDYKEVMFLYEHYRDFRTMVDAIYEKVACNQLKKVNKLQNYQSKTLISK